MTIKNGSLPYIDLAYSTDETFIYDPIWDEPESEFEDIKLPRTNKRGIDCHYLIDDLVKAIKVDKTEKIIGDKENYNLVLRIKPTGGKTWYFHPRGDGGRPKCIGSSSDYPVAHARKIAERMLTAPEDSPIKVIKKVPRNATLTEAAAMYFGGRRQIGDEKLLNEYLLSDHGSYRPSTIRPRVWPLAVGRASHENLSRGRKLHTRLRAFLNWLKDHRLISGNPLSRTKPLYTPVYKAYPFYENDARAIYSAAQELGWPWSALFGLTMITGEPIEYVRHIQSSDIDWNKGEWTVDNSECADERPKPRKPLLLSPTCLALLEPHKNIRGYLFQSARTQKPINVYPEIIIKLKKLSDVDGNWRLKDIKGIAKNLFTEKNDEVDL